jgi:hypothetical protein
MKNGVVCVFAGALVAGLPSVAGAAGAFFPESGRAESTQQRAILVLEGNITTMIVQTGFRGDASDMAWAIPTTGLAMAVRLWDAARDVFDLLHAETGVKLASASQKRKDLGCTRSGRAFVTTTHALPIDAMTYTNKTVLTQHADGPLPLWPYLEANNYQVSVEARDILEEYSQQGSFYAVVELEGVGEAGANQDPLDEDVLGPFAIEMHGHQPVMPLLISTVSSTAAAEIELYVIARERYEPIEYGARELQVETWFDGGDFDDWYSEQVDQAFSRAQDTAFLVEYADFIDLGLVQHVLGRAQSIVELGATDWFVTRLRGRLRPDEIDSDVHLRALDGDPGKQRFQVRVVSGGRPEKGSAAFGILVLLGGGAGLMLRRRRRGKHQGPPRVGAGERSENAGQGYR